MRHLERAVLVVLTMTVTYWVAPTHGYWVTLGILLGLWVAGLLFAYGGNFIALLLFARFFKADPFAEEETARVVALVGEAIDAARAGGDPLTKVREAVEILADALVSKKNLRAGDILEAERRFACEAGKNHATQQVSVVVLRDAVLSYVLQQRVQLGDGRVATPIGWIKNGELMEETTR